MRMNPSTDDTTTNTNTNVDGDLDGGLMGEFSSIGLDDPFGSQTDNAQKQLAKQQRKHGAREQQDITEYEAKTMDALWFLKENHISGSSNNNNNNDSQHQDSANATRLIDEEYFEQLKLKMDYYYLRGAADESHLDSALQMCDQFIDAYWANSNAKKKERAAAKNRTIPNTSQQQQQQDTTTTTTTIARKERIEKIAGYSGLKEVYETKARILLHQQRYEEALQAIKQGLQVMADAHQRYCLFQMRATAFLSIYTQQQQQQQQQQQLPERHRLVRGAIRDLQQCLLKDPHNHLLWRGVEQAYSFLTSINNNNNNSNNNAEEGDKRYDDVIRIAREKAAIYSPNPDTWKLKFGKKPIERPEVPNFFTTESIIKKYKRDATTTATTTTTTDGATIAASEAEQHKEEEEEEQEDIISFDDDKLCHLHIFTDDDDHDDDDDLNTVATVDEEDKFLKTVLLKTPAVRQFGNKVDVADSSERGFNAMKW